MPLFRSSKKKDPPNGRSVSPQPVETLSRRGSGISISSFKSDAVSEPPQPTTLGRIFGRSNSVRSTTPDQPSQPSPKQVVAQQRVTTIQENIEDSDDAEDDSYYENDSDFEMHTHENKFQSKESYSLTSQFLEYCGIKVYTGESARQLANEESKNTYSLLDNVKSFRLDNKNPYQSVICELQVKVIKSLKNTILDLIDNNALRDRFAQEHPTMYEKYGVVKKVVGKGSYGVIKIIDKSDKELTNLDGRKLYAVKELIHRSESNSAFADRVLSEFIISASLNNKHLTKSVDLMITLSDSNTPKLSSVMEFTPGGDLFSYMVSKHSNRVMSLDEIDCFIKQISKGVGYMHQHGVAHCDLKLENVLLKYTPDGGIQLRVTDFGNSNVFRIAFDTKEQLYENGKLGSTSYMCPEEFGDSAFSLSKKDCWALGIIILILFRIRKQAYSGICDQEDIDEDLEYPRGYLWSTTESVRGKYKDKVFDEYAKTKMIADYDRKNLDWYVKRRGSFKPIEQLFVDETTHKEIDDTCELRRYIIYKLLDLNPQSRLCIKDLLDTDWLTGVEICK